MLLNLIENLQFFKSGLKIPTGQQTGAVEGPDNNQSPNSQISLTVDVNDFVLLVYNTILEDVN